MEALRCCVFALIMCMMVSMCPSATIFGEEVFLGLAEFKDKIVTSEEWINLWRIEIGQPTERIRRKIKAKWTETADGKILRNTVTWRPETDVCVLVDVLTEPDETEVWGEGGVVLKQVNSTFNRYVRFVSTNATSYFWWVVCFNSTAMTAEGHCPDLLVMLMVPASRITPDRHRVADMTGLPMEDIVSVLHEISVIKGTDVGFQMERFRYTWIGTECDFHTNKIGICTGETSGTTDYRASSLGWFNIIVTLSLYYQLRG